jgi:DNA-binding NarL/FixJ family response regulator
VGALGPAALVMQIMETIPMISLFLVDDQPAVRRGLRMRLALAADFLIAGEAEDDVATRKQATAAGATALLSKHAADTTLVDVLQHAVARQRP